MERGHLGVGENIHVRRVLDAIDQVLRQGLLETGPADDDADLPGIARKVHGCLTGRVSAADNQDVLIAAERCFTRPGSVENSGA